MKLDFSKAINRFEATSIVFAGVRAGLVTEAEGWQEWANVEGARRDATRTPAAKALAARNRAIDARNKAARVAQRQAEAVKAQREYFAKVDAERAALAARTIAEEDAARVARAQAAAADRIRREAERVEREEAAMTAEQRRKQRLERDQDTSDEVGRIMQGAFDLAAFGGAN